MDNIRQKILDTKEQLQEDIMTYLDDEPTQMVDFLCDLVVKNFNRLLDECRN